MDLSQHWDKAYRARNEDALTWFENMPEASLRLVRDHLPEGGALIDVGAGASRLVDHLLADGHAALTLLDLSAEALAITKARLGAKAGQVSFVTADVREWAPDRTYDLWHDRAVFHFLTEPADQKRYLETLDETLRPGGIAIIATFGLTGPERCSDLPVQRYSPETLAGRVEELMPGMMTLVQSEHQTHRTPKGNTQSFQISVFRKKETRP
ncbi:class I SAM-dependent methyltransferase [Halovulum dunhuangense]|nr:class I SAM-dependent methyltransferase [Halovulum dunhuangense]